MSRWVSSRLLTVFCVIQAVATAATDLAGTLAQIANAVDQPLVIFNPSSWSRSEVIELNGTLPNAGDLPQPTQQISPGHVAIWADRVPSVGYAAIMLGTDGAISNPAAATQVGQQITLTNGLVAVTLDGLLTK